MVPRDESDTSPVGDSSSCCLSSSFANWHAKILPITATSKPDEKEAIGDALPRTSATSLTDNPTTVSATIFGTAVVTK